MHGRIPAAGTASASQAIVLVAPFASMMSIGASACAPFAAATFAPKNTRADPDAEAARRCCGVGARIDDGRDVEAGRAASAAVRQPSSLLVNTDEP